MSKDTIDISQISLKLPEPKWGSPLANLILDLEKLKVRVFGGTTPEYIFFEIKNTFQYLESLGSARIEGNNTTISELVEKIIENTNPNKDESLAEIFNIYNAIEFINENIEENTKINKGYITEIHKIIVSKLNREGSKTIGDYRKENVTISKSNIKPPHFAQVDDYMSDLFHFINNANDSENHLLRICVAHHYFTFIHPFDNGNGRVVRLLTLLMLVKYGFNIKKGNILNPTAIFCSDREKYYEMLNLADHGDIETWCIYVLSGLKEEINKIDKIGNYSYIQIIFKKIVQHALSKKIY